MDVRARNQRRHGQDRAAGLDVAAD
jgi:hypothetical protein